MPMTSSFNHLETNHGGCPLATAKLYFHERKLYRTTTILKRSWPSFYRFHVDGRLGNKALFVLRNPISHPFIFACALLNPYGTRCSSLFCVVVRISSDRIKGRFPGHFADRESKTNGKNFQKICNA